MEKFISSIIHDTRSMSIFYFQRRFSIQLQNTRGCADTVRQIPGTNEGERGPIDPEAVSKGRHWALCSCGNESWPRIRERILEEDSSERRRGHLGRG